MTPALPMQAVYVDASGRLSLQKTTRPEPRPSEVRIRIQVTAVNRADLLQKKGLYPPPPGASDILGLECAGTVDAVGEGVRSWQIGDAVCALLSGGGYAEYVCVDARHCLPLPAGLSFAQGAALPEVFATAWLNLYGEARLQPGETVFLPAGASGVGTAAIQLCHLFGNPCHVSVGSEDKLRRCIDLGAESGVVRGVTAPRALLPDGVDVILDPVAGDALDEHLALLRENGRLVLIGIMGGRSGQLDLGRVLVKRLRLIGSTLRSRSADEKAALIAELATKVWPHFGQDNLRPVIDRCWPLGEAEAAHDYVAANRNVGKVVLTVS